MSDIKAKRLSKIAREFNVGILTITEFLKKNGYTMDTNPNTKVTDECYDLLVKEYDPDRKTKEASDKLDLGTSRIKKESITLESSEAEVVAEESEEDAESFELEKEETVNVKIVGKIDLDKEPRKKHKRSGKPK